MKSISLALWFMVKSFINGIKRSWKVFLGIAVICCVFILIGVVVGSLSEDSSDDYEDETEVIEEIDEEYVPNYDLDFVMDDDGAFFYEDGNKYDVGDLLIRIIISFVVLIFIVIGIVGGSKKGAAIFEMADVNFLFPSPMKPQSVLLFKMICQIGTAILGSFYIVYQMPNLINNAGLKIGGAIGIILGYLVLIVLSKFISVFSYVFLSNHEKLKAFVSKYGYFFIAVPIVLAAAFHFLLGMGYYDSVNAVFNTRVCSIVPFWGWLSMFGTEVILGRYLYSIIFFVLTILGMGVLVWGTWKIPCDFYEDAFENAVVLDETNKQAQNVAAGGMAYGVKHEGKAQEKKWNKRRNNTLAFDGYEGASVFFAKTMLNRKRMYSWGGLWSSACSFYFWASAGACGFLYFITDLKSPLMLAVIPTAICLVSMFFRSFLNPLQVELSQNFIYMIPESPFSLLGYGMAGQIFDGAIDLIPMSVVIAIFSRNIGYGICCWLLLLSMHMFFGMTALLVNLVISSYLPLFISNILQVIIRVLPFLPVVLAFIFGLASGSEYMTFILVTVVNVCVSLLTFIPCPFFLHKGKR